MTPDPYRHGLSRTAATYLIVGVCALLLIIACVLLVPSLCVDGADRERTLSAAHARQLAMATLLRQDQDTDSVITVDFQQLLDDHYVTEELLASPFGPVPDGRGDYWAYPEPIEIEAIADPDRLVIIYDRAAYRAGPYVPVAFLDGHVEALSVADFERLIAQPPNGQVDYDQPARQ